MTCVVKYAANTMTSYVCYAEQDSLIGRDKETGRLMLFAWNKNVNMFTCLIQTTLQHVQGKTKGYLDDDCLRNIA